MGQIFGENTLEDLQFLSNILCTFWEDANKLKQPYQLAANGEHILRFERST